eukprot:7113439-Pyramimonas_sp.AAC.1
MSLLLWLNHGLLDAVVCGAVAAEDLAGDRFHESTDAGYVIADLHDLEVAVIRTLRACREIDRLRYL